MLAAILPNRPDLLEEAQRQINDGHLPDRTLANIYAFLERYADVTGGSLPTRDALGEALRRRKLDAGTIAHYQEVFDLLVERQVDDGAFRWSVEQLRELAAERATGEALTQAMEILTRGAEDDRGNQLLGHAAAWEQLLSRHAEIERDLSMQDAPEGDMRGEGKDILADYAKRKDARLRGHSTGIEFGIPTLDAKIGGINRGDLALIVGYTSEGKTGLCVQLAWNACVMQGKNVVFLTTETPREQVRRRLISRHSMHPLFEYPDGLNSKDIKDGTLDDAGERMLTRVTDDFDRNPGHGRCYIVQVPRAAGMGYVEAKLTRLNRMFEVDLALMDYFALLKPDRRRNSDREELGSIIKEAKQICTTFNGGMGVPMVSPWQVNRTARMEAERTGYYTSSALSETSEASNTPDILVSLLAPMDNDKRHVRVRLQAMKHRDGERANSILSDLDYATSCFTEDGGNGAARPPGRGPSPTVDPYRALLGD